MKDDPGPEPRYKWTYTWPGERHKDYVGYDGDRQIGRIFFDAAGPTKGLWRWAAGTIREAKLPGPMPHNGYKPSARLAAKAVEDHYEARMQICGLPYGHGKRNLDPETKKAR